MLFTKFEKESGIKDNKNKLCCQVLPSQSKQVLVSISNEIGRNCTGIVTQSRRLLAVNDCIDQLG